MRTNQRPVLYDIVIIFTVALTQGPVLYDIVIIFALALTQGPVLYDIVIKFAVALTQGHVLYDIVIKFAVAFRIRPVPLRVPIWVSNASRYCDHLMYILVYRDHVTLIFIAR